MYMSKRCAVLFGDNFPIICRIIKILVPLERYLNVLIFSTIQFFKSKKVKKNEEENLLLLKERCYENNLLLLMKKRSQDHCITQFLHHMTILRGEVHPPAFNGKRMKGCNMLTLENELSSCLISEE